MTLCPYAIIKNCRECKLMKICPLKKFIGDYQEKETEADKEIELNEKLRR